MKLEKMKTGLDSQLYLLGLSIIIAILIAGFTGLAWSICSLLPAKSIEPRYAPDNIIVYMAELSVNLVLLSVELKYKKTKKKLASISRTSCFNM